MDNIEYEFLHSNGRCKKAFVFGQLSTLKWKCFSKSKWKRLSFALVAVCQKTWMQVSVCLAVLFTYFEIWFFKNGLTGEQLAFVLAADDGHLFFTGRYKKRRNEKYTPAWDQHQKKSSLCEMLVSDMPLKAKWCY